jgi:hypothetical protein
MHCQIAKPSDRSFRSFAYVPSIAQGDPMGGRTVKAAQEALRRGDGPGTLWQLYDAS